jgi:hypothetical protein
VQSQVRFNRIPEEIPEKVSEASAQSRVRFNRVREKVWEALVQSQVKFIRVPEKIPPGFGAKPGQIH